MKTEIKNIQEYNPEYRHDGTLVWKKIGEPVGKKGKHLRSKKQYPPISITLDGDTHIITTTYTSHDVCNDFNYEFFRIGNTINNRNNRISVSLPCNVVIKYTPIIKDTP